MITTGGTGASSDGRPAGIALAAGAGTRLRPLTDLRPKALCPVGGRPLVDWALDRLRPLTGTGPDRLAVNAHHQADQVLAHFGSASDSPSQLRSGEDPCADGARILPASWVQLGDRGGVRVQVEHGEALGTAGAVAALLPWLDGRPALVTNADSYLPSGLPGFTDGWDGERCRLLCLPTTGRPDFTADDGTPLTYVGACLLPWHRIRDLRAVPSGLYEVLWRQDVETGGLDLFQLPAGTAAIDCGTPADYLAANLHASGGEPVIGAGATVLGTVQRSVIWDGAWVGPGESLTDVIRAGDRAQPLTVDARSR